MVVIVGLTGAGKTTFTNLVSGRTDLEVGDGIDPCTQEPAAVQFELDGRPVVLIDTPGFDDTTRNDVQILEDIAKWLPKQDFFSKKQPIDGMILLYPITSDFDSTLEKRRTRILQKILGKNAYKRVVIATTMWGSLIDETEVERDISMRWQQEGGVWDEFRQGGAHLTKHSNTKQSADRILRIIIKASDDAERARILIQEELARKNVWFADTALAAEIRTLLDQDIEHISQLLLKNRNRCPPESFHTSERIEEWEQWYRWYSEKHELNKNLEMLHKQRKSLDSVFVSTYLCFPFTYFLMSILPVPLSPHLFFCPKEFFSFLFLSV